MSVQRLKGRMDPNLMEKLKAHPRTSSGAWDMPEGTRWLALHRHHDEDANVWDLTDQGPSNHLEEGPWEEPGHGPNPLSMPMLDNAWDRIHEHNVDPHTGLLGLGGASTYIVKARIQVPKARAVSREV